MTHVGPAVEATATSVQRASFVEWGPVLAGALVASALSFVLLTFGAAIGLSATSPWPNSGVSAKVLASLAVFWTLSQQIGAFMVGGYLAGRMRNRWAESSHDEVEFRDGLHGGLVWAVGVVLGAALLMMAAGATARTGAQIAGKGAEAAIASTSSDSMETVVDTMLRPTAPGKAPAQGSSEAEQRKEVSRILAASVTTGSLSNENRTYLAQLVAQRTGLSQPEAEKRINDAQNAAREAADKARRAGILTGLVTAVSLVISLGAAWWAGTKGGDHRDNSIPARFAFDRGRLSNRQR